MPPTELLVFREANGRIPLVDWLDVLPAKARAKCLNYMRLLATSGHELRRPAADFLRDGIYEPKNGSSDAAERAFSFSRKCLQQWHLSPVG